MEEENCGGGGLWRRGIVEDEEGLWKRMMVEEMDCEGRGLWRRGVVEEEELVDCDADDCDDDDYREHPEHVNYTTETNMV